MLNPRLLFEENPAYPNEVAVMVSLVPTFEPLQPQDTVFEDEEPTPTCILNPQDFVYIFVVDRSGSMEGKRMEITN